MQRNKVSEEVGKIMKVMKLRNRNEVMKCETKMNKSILHHHPQLTNSFLSVLMKTYGGNVPDVYAIDVIILQIHISI